jgi:hypothetical protein
MKCRDFGDRPGCLGEIDERYTMRFDDIGEPPIYWCSNCGAEAQLINGLITEAFKTQPGFKQKFARAIHDAETKCEICGLKYINLENHCKEINDEAHLVLSVHKL